MSKRSAAIRAAMLATSVFMTVPPSQVGAPGTGGGDTGTGDWHATSLNEAVGYFSGGQTYNEHNTAEVFLGMEMNFNLQFASGNWGNSNDLQPTTMDSTLTGAQSRLNPAGALITNLGDHVTFVITLPLITGNQNLQTAVIPTNNLNRDFWWALGDALEDSGLCDSRFASGRYRVILRVGWELDGDWYPWGTNADQTGRNLTNFQQNSINQRGVRELVHGWVSSRLTHPENLGWDVNYNTSGRSLANNELVIPDHPGVILTQDCYDEIADYNGLTQAQKDALLQTVITKKLTSASGLRAILGLAVKHNTLYGLDEMGVWYNTTTTKATAGGDHPDWWNGIHGFFMNEVVPIGRASHIVHFDANSPSGGSHIWSGSTGTTYAPNQKSRLASLLPYP
jgi:hypothetical protein